VPVGRRTCHVKRARLVGAHKAAMPTAYFSLHRKGA
jgi:hypothetical protein